MADRRILRKFLEEKGCKNPDEVMAVLEPFFKHAEADKYELAAANEEAKAKIAEAVVKATKKRIDKVIFISVAARPFSKPKWMTADVYQRTFISFVASLWASFRASFRNSLGHSLWDILDASLWDNLIEDGLPWASLGESLDASLGHSLEASLGESLWGSLWASFRNSLGVSLWDSLWNSLEASRLWDSIGENLDASLGDSLLYYLGFALANNQERSDELKSLLEVMADYLVLGFKKDEPETLLVLCE